MTVTVTGRRHGVTRSRGCPTLSHSGGLAGPGRLAAWAWVTVTDSEPWTQARDPPAGMRPPGRAAAGLPRRLPRPAPVKKRRRSLEEIEALGRGPDWPGGSGPSRDLPRRVTPRPAGMQGRRSGCVMTRNPSPWLRLRLGPRSRSRSRSPEPDSDSETVTAAAAPAARVGSTRQCQWARAAAVTQSDLPLRDQPGWRPRRRQPQPARDRDRVDSDSATDVVRAWPGSVPVTRTRARGRAQPEPMQCRGGGPGPGGPAP